MTVVELRKMAKDLDIKGITKLKKVELIKEINEKTPITINKGGVILKENIIPKKLHNFSNDNIKSIDQNDTQNKSEVLEEGSSLEKGKNLKEMIHESQSAKGVLEIIENNNYGFLRGENYLTGPKDIYVSPSRSEERRVGKECRSRWSPYH